MAEPQNQSIARIEFLLEGLTYISPSLKKFKSQITTNTSVDANDVDVDSDVEDFLGDYN